MHHQGEQSQGSSRMCDKLEAVLAVVSCIIKWPSDHSWVSKLAEATAKTDAAQQGLLFVGQSQEI